MPEKNDLEKLKVPPHSIDAEQSVLGGVLLANEAFHSVIDILIAEDFYLESHRQIYTSLCELDHRNEPIDVVTLTHHLKNHLIDERKPEKGSRLDAIGGVSYLSMLLESVPTAANISVYANIVKEKATIRRLLSTITGIAKECYDSYGDVEDFLNRTETEIFKVTEHQIKTTTLPLEQVIKSAFRRVNALHDRKELITGVTSGYEDLDKYTSGFQKSDLIIIAGRPGMGKTAFGMNVALNASEHAKTPIAIFSLEMSQVELGLRLLSMEAKVDSMNIRHGKISKKD